MVYIRFKFNIRRLSSLLVRLPSMSTTQLLVSQMSNEHDLGCKRDKIGVASKYIGMLGVATSVILQ